MLLPHVRLREVALVGGIAFLIGACDRDTPEPTAVVPEELLQPSGPLAAIAPGTPILMGASDIATCGSSGDEATASLLGAFPDAAVFTAGDNVDNGTSDEFSSCFGSSWGTYKARIRPSPGERDYRTSDATPYFQYFGSAAGTAGQGYYSYDVGAWHVVVLNSSISMAAGSPQERWLRADLAASTRACTAAYWHLPRFFSSRTWDATDATSRAGPTAVWQALYEHGAELVINGDNRSYERFAPQTPDGALDRARGIRQFIVGTGGQGLMGSRGVAAPNSEVWNGDTFGVLMIGLEASGYSWEFVPVSGGTFTDSGSGLCDGPVDPGNSPPVADAGGPYAAVEGGAVTLDGRASSDPDRDALTYFWSFGDGTTGNGAQPVHTYADNGTYNVVLTVTDAGGRSSAPDSTLAVISNAAPVVNAGANANVDVMESFALSATFSDAGVSDSPWTYRIEWGDGSPATSGSSSNQSQPITASHAFAVAGQYRVRVIVTDKNGGSGRDSLTVTVDPAPADGPFTFVATGHYHTCALTPTGSAYCWGYNTNRGQLGDGTFTNKSLPSPVVGGLSFRFLAGGGYHTCGITNGGDAYCWGRNNEGQLGDGTFTDTNRPVPVISGDKFTAISAGAFFTCALTTAGRVYCWGANERGQLGDDRTTRSNRPVQVVGGYTFAFLRAGYHHSCGIVADGTAYCWGKNSMGQLGDGTTTDRRRPTLVAGGHTWANVSMAGSADGAQNHTCAITTSNVAYCWGDNWHNQLGVDVTRGTRTVPTEVRNVPALGSIVTGEDHSCGVALSGAGWCWGDNLKGQLGLGPGRTDFNPATEVVGGHSFSMLSLGSVHSCGLTTAGELYCWGYNDRGQIGDGTNTMRIRPVQVIFSGST